MNDQTTWGKPTTRNQHSWNRSSAFSPEILARLTAATNRSIEKGLRILKTAPDFAYMSARQRNKAIKIVCDGVSKEVEKFADQLRKQDVTDL
jgi:hypothetical protein